LSFPGPHADEIHDVGPAPADETEKDNIYKEGGEPLQEAGILWFPLDYIFVFRVCAHFAHLELLLFQDADDIWSMIICQLIFAGFAGQPPVSKSPSVPLCERGI
jgi:hypothetical protein